MILSRSSGTINFDVKPTPTLPSFVGSSRIASSGGGGVKLGNADGALSSALSFGVFFFLYTFFDTV